MFLSSADFAIRYFQLYDTHRDKLIHAYQDEATFRLNIPNIGHGRYVYWTVRFVFFYTVLASLLILFPVIVCAAVCELII